MIRPRLYLLAIVAFLAIGLHQTTEAIGFNTAMLFRYPWQPGITMTRTQGWGGLTSHTGNLQYAVDWDNCDRCSWPIMAASGGETQCRRDGLTVFDGLGNLVGTYDPISNQTALNAHATTCGYFAEGVSYTVTQGQWVANTGTSGGARIAHLHFQVAAGRVFASPASQAFTMSDKSGFPETSPFPSDGPSDNVGVAYASSALGDVDQTLRNTYIANGGYSAWWNVGSTYQSTTESFDEWGGVCRNTATAFVHICGTNVGSGLLAAQNYIDYKGVRHSVYRSSASSGVVKGQIQGALSNLYGPGAVSKVLGAPVNAEFGGVQTFDGGYIVRNNGAGIRSDVYLCTPFGCGLILIARYSSLGTFCPSVNADTKVNSTDLLLVAQHASQPYDPQYDLNGDAKVNSTDLLLVAGRSNAYCPVADP